VIDPENGRGGVFCFRKEETSNNRKGKKSYGGLHQKEKVVSKKLPTSEEGKEEGEGYALLDDSNWLKKKH